MDISDRTDEGIASIRFRTNPKVLGIRQCYRVSTTGCPISVSIDTELLSDSRASGIRNINMVPISIVDRGASSERLSRCPIADREVDFPSRIDVQNITRRANPIPFTNNRLLRTT